MTDVPPCEIGRRQFTAMRAGDLADFEDHVHPEATNREAKDEPLACRGRGAPSFLATGIVLRAVFANLEWTVHETVVEDDLVVAHVMMTGRQVATFYRYDERGRVDAAFPADGRSFSTNQTHWWRMADGLMIEHWANRDDMGMALQLGWVPPRPRFLARMAVAMVRARRAEARRGGPIAEGLEAGS